MSASSDAPKEAGERPVPARPAATLVLLRLGASGEPETLLGQRGGGAAFMPSKVVFPGGGMDPEDVRLAEALSEDVDPAALDDRLERAREADRDTGAPLAQTPPGPVLRHALALAAIRETFEETGLRLGRREGAAAARVAEAAQRLGGSWAAFTADGLAPAVETLGFFFRAITPPYLPRRFDARFFAAFAGAVQGDPSDFSGASGELSPLHWTPLSAAAEYDLPFVTHLVIAESQAMAARCAQTAGPGSTACGLEALAETARRRPAPFFRHSAAAADPVVRSRFEAL